MPESDFLTAGSAAWAKVMLGAAQKRPLTAMSEDIKRIFMRTSQKKELQFNARD
jgi:hypothetical protein